MAVFMPFTAYYIFTIFCKQHHPIKKIFIVAFISGYISLVLTAVLTAVEFGIQPYIASSPDGKALYCPYDLSIAIPAMLIEHLLLFGVLEGIITAFIVRYFVKNEPSIVYAFHKGGKNEID